MDLHPYDGVERRFRNTREDVSRVLGCRSLVTVDVLLEDGVELDDLL